MLSEARKANKSDAVEQPRECDAVVRGHLVEPVIAVDPPLSDEVRLGAYVTNTAGIA